MRLVLIYMLKSFFGFCRIDSKAMFADETTFAENLEQFQAYNNRYGCGLVIYWHGFLETLLPKIEGLDGMIQITNSFPDTWLYPDGKLTSSSEAS